MPKASCTRDSGLHPEGKGGGLKLKFAAEKIIATDTAIAILVRITGMIFQPIFTTTYEPQAQFS
jgi:hypothetical protein